MAEIEAGKESGKEKLSSKDRPGLKALLVGALVW